MFCLLMFAGLSALYGHSPPFLRGPIDNLVSGLQKAPLAGTSGPPNSSADKTKVLWRLKKKGVPRQKGKELTPRSS